MLFDPGSSLVKNTEFADLPHPPLARVLLMVRMRAVAPLARWLSRHGAGCRPDSTQPAPAMQRRAGEALGVFSNVCCASSPHGW